MENTRTRRTHNRVVIECYQAIKKAQEDPDTEKLLRVMRRYGRTTREQAIEMLKEEAAERMGMTVEEYEKYLESDESEL